MSSFFSLGTGIGIGINKEDDDHHQQPPHHGGGGETSSPPNNNSLYLFKNEEIYSKGFELWQQCYQLHQRVVSSSQTQTHHHLQHHQQQLQDHHDSILLGVGPSRQSFTLGNSNTSDHQNNINNNNTNTDDTTKFMMRQAAGFGIGGGGSGGGSGGGMNCQDCGNQAKKDCIHMRCRTCCKSRGFHCQTHVKSTWVPAAKRRERQQQLASLTQQQQQQQQNQQQQQQQSLQNQQLSLMMRGGGSRDQNVPKRLREDHLSLPTQHHHSTGLELGNFPSEVSSPAVFRCVRVSAMDDADEQFAYQTAVNIAGHTFKGILYDQGPEGRYNPGGGGESSSGGGGGGSHQQPPQALNLITSSAAAAAATSVATSYNPALTFIDPSSMYPAPLNAFMAGTQFFPPPRP